MKTPARSRYIVFSCIVGFALLFGFTSTQGCNCDTQVGRTYDTEIDFLKPRGTIISEGLTQVKVKDLDGLVEVKISVGGKVVKTEKYDATDEKSEVTITAEFKLDDLPDSFDILVETLDSQEETASKKLSVIKEASPPSIRIVLPEKLDPKHDAIFVGKKFTTAAESTDDREGVKKIVMTIKRKDGTEQEIKQCSGSSEPGKKERCETEVDASDDKVFPEGPLVIQAQATDEKNNQSITTKLQVIMDKSGPQLKIISPLDNEQLTPTTELRVLALDQVGVKEVKFTLAGNAINATADPNKPGHFVATAGNSLGAGTVEFKVTALDNLDNPSEASTKPRAGCQTDADCEQLKPGTRCCLAKSAANPDEKLNGTCQEVVNTEGGLCDPCTQPCGKGSDGKLMGCLPQPCTDQPPYRCRRACNLGNPNRAADSCQPASAASPAEYCTRSDITKFDPTLGSCAIGHKCDPVNPKVCPAGMKPPYNNCCPSGMTCFPADKDANFCVVAGNKKEGETGCINDLCSGGNTCGSGMVCVTPIGANGQPSGPARCNKLCTCDQLCQSGLFPQQSNCNTGQFCTPLTLTNGNVRLPVGACTSP